MALRRLMALVMTVTGALALTVAVPTVAQAYSVGGVYKLVSLGSGQCLYVKSDGQKMGTGNCSQGADDQKWTLESTSDTGYYKFANVRYIGCLDAPNSGWFPDVWNDPCTAGAGSQKWEIQSTTTSGYYKLVNQRYGWCLTNFADIETCAEGATNQKWKLQSAS